MVNYDKHEWLEAERQKIDDLDDQTIRHDQPELPDELAWP